MGDWEGSEAVTSYFHIGINAQNDFASLLVRVNCELLKIFQDSFSGIIQAFTKSSLVLTPHSESFSWVFAWDTGWDCNSATIPCIPSLCHNHLPGPDGSLPSSWIHVTAFSLVDVKTPPNWMGWVDKSWLLHALLTFHGPFRCFALAFQSWPFSNQFQSSPVSWCSQTSALSCPDKDLNVLLLFSDNPLIGILSMFWLVTLECSCFLFLFIPMLPQFCASCPWLTIFSFLTSWFVIWFVLFNDSVSFSCLVHLYFVFPFHCGIVSCVVFPLVDVNIVCCECCFVN